MNERKLQNFRAFTKLYGYIRFFHPSDEASSIDWDKFSVYGFEKVENAPGDKELKYLLLELFLPIAPSIEVYLTGEEITYDLKKIIPADTTGLLPVAWQHHGIQTNHDKIYDVYKSVRVNRIPKIVHHSAELSRVVDASEFRGKKIKLSAGIKIPFDEKDTNGDLWIKTFKANGKESQYSETHIKVGKWKKDEAEIDVEEDDSKIEYGVRLNNEGLIYINGFTMEYFNGVTRNLYSLEDGKFENQEIGKAPQNWNIADSDYIYEIIDYDTFDNDKACIIQSSYKKQPFEKYPVPGELINKPISTGLNCIIPLTLYTDTYGTLPKANEKLLNDLHIELSNSKYNELNADNKYVRLAGIAKFWNVIQHSYSYFELFNINWNSILDESLNYAYDSKDGIEFLNYLQLITAKLNDGHTGAVYNKQNFFYSFPPVFYDHAEGKYIISRLTEDNTGLIEGDIIVEIDGRDVYDIAAEESKLISSATEGWRINRILGGKLTKGEMDSIINFKINRAGIDMTIETKRKYKWVELLKMGYNLEYRPEKITEIKSGIFYVDLTRLTTKELDENIPVLAEAKGVIFDVRGYPKLECEFLNHLSAQKLYSAKWNVPQIIYPDFEHLVGYDTAGRWEMEPLEPQFKGKIVFLTNAGAISYAESIMGIVEAYSLGDIVGETTAGTNGDVNPILLPGGYTVWYTGMKVLKHDDSVHHGVGIKPTVPVNRTIKGISEKRDEYLEKALELIESAK